MWKKYTVLTFLSLFKKRDVNYIKRKKTKTKKKKQKKTSMVNRMNGKVFLKEFYFAGDYLSTIFV